MTLNTDIISWKNLGCKLSKNTYKALDSLKFEKPTPIQTHVIPTFLKKKDIVAQAVTGSGKTLSFIIPIIELLNKMESIKSSDVFSVILSPTTELANQTYEMFKSFLENFNGIKPNLKLFNKKFISTEIESNKGIVIISTPGAFAKAIEKTVENAKLIKSLKTTEILILDEADRLLEMGFEDQLMTIIKSLPKQRLTGLFSATQTTEVEDLIRAGLRNPVRVSVKVKQGDESVLNDNLPKNMTNYYLTVNGENKLDILIQFLKDKRNKKVLIFFAACACVDYYKSILSLILKKQVFLAFHKKMKNKRASIFEKFKTMKSGVMLCTDVMARGIDIPDIDWVVQFDPPKSATNFVHRCGRTARCDQFGQTLIFLRSTEDTYLHFLRENQNVEMKEYITDFNPDEVESYEIRMQDFCISDRLLYEKSVNAYIAYVMFYKKHELKYIFKLSDVNMGKLANSFGLLRIPQMCELKDIDLSDFHKRDVDLKSLIYKDKSVRNIREKTRVIKQQRRETEAMEVDDEVEDEKPVKKVNGKKTKNENVKKVDGKNTQNENVKSNTKENNRKMMKRNKPMKDTKKPQSKKAKLSADPVEQHEKMEIDNEMSQPAEKTKKKQVIVEGKGLLGSFNKKNKL